MDYAHGTGHGVGSYLGVHEGPQRISKLPSRVALAPGMICSNEPGYYRAGAYGIRIENLVAVTAPGSDRADGEPDGAAADVAGMQGFETLTLVPYDRALIDTGLLTTGEIAWIDAYHARVNAAIRPRVDAETADWLDAATAPLRA
jgi:Xaa-Pro aminopeptidase